LKKVKNFQNKFGIFKHDDIAEKPYGSKILCNKNKGYIFVLRFIPYLFEKCISKMTQILFNPDISMIMTFLNINKHSIIYESGTGSGCLSFNICKNLEDGHLYTFEFNKERATKLQENFKYLKIDSKATITHRDVVENGFELDKSQVLNEKHLKCNSIFIDLPSPWLIVEHVKKVLTNDGIFVSFSPCIEQIHETVKKLKENNFFNIRMFECMYRSFNYTKTIKKQLYQ